MVNPDATDCYFYKYFTRKEEKQLLSHIAKHKSLLAQRDHAWIRFGLRTGARVETLAGFTVDDAALCLKEKKIIFRAEILKGRKEGSLVRVGKKRKPLVIMLTDARKAALLDLLRVRRAMGFPDDEHNQALVMSERGEGLSIRSFQARIKEWAIDAGLERGEEVSPHWLRHTCAKRIYAASTAKDPRVSVKIELGHSSLASTDIYTQPDKETHIAAIVEAC